MNKLKFSMGIWKHCKKTRVCSKIPDVYGFRNRSLMCLRFIEGLLQTLNPTLSPDSYVSCEANRLHLIDRSSQQVMTRVIYTPHWPSWTHSPQSIVPGLLCDYTWALPSFLSLDTPQSVPQSQHFRGFRDLSSSELATNKHLLYGKG